ncbi:MAG: hypothetical protein H6R26_3544, partial [Proteobacteria bacterium]|nr:hypothetical protein [Pseudomonadota bacterium]
DGSADLRMTSENPHGLLNKQDRLGRDRRIGIDQEVGQTLQITQSPLRIDQPRQGFALGLADFFPDTRF